MNASAINIIYPPLTSRLVGVGVLSNKLLCSCSSHTVSEAWDGPTWNTFRRSIKTESTPILQFTDVLNNSKLLANAASRLDVLTSAEVSVPQEDSAVESSKHPAHRSNIKQANQ